MSAMALERELSRATLWVFEALPDAAKISSQEFEVLPGGCVKEPPPIEVQESRTQRRLSARELMAFCERILNLADPARRPIREAGTTAWPIMNAFFLSLQTDNMAAMLALARGNRGAASMATIAGAMLKGMAQLRWVRLKPTERAAKWEKWSWVYDYYELKYRKQHNEPVTPQQEAEIMRRIKGASEFLNPATRRPFKRHKGRPYRPYLMDWYAPATIEDIFCDAGFGELYSTVYHSCHQVHDWGPGAFALFIGEEAGYESHRPETLAMVLVAAFQALFITLDSANEALDLGLADRMAPLVHEFIAASTSGDSCTEPLLEDEEPALVVYERPFFDQQARNDAVIRLLGEWGAEASDEQQRTWAFLEHAIDEDRLSDRKFFSQQ